MVDLIQTNDKRPILDVRNLRTYFYVNAGTVKAVDGITFTINPGIKMGLVGESGSGKSTVALSILRMIRPPGTINGEIILDGVDLLKLSAEEMRQSRMTRVSMIPQGAMNILNPVMRIENQILDALADHGINLTKQEKKKRVAELLDLVELPSKVARMYPHELSGGMKQRVCVAVAISLGPKFLIADEPTSALDVVIQRQVMDTITGLVNDLNLSMVLIGHDMGLMAQAVDRLAVMYAGKLAEIGDVRGMFSEPYHPYTQALIESLPILGQRGVFQGIPGIPPSVINPPPGCLFSARCPKVLDDICPVESPPLREIKPGHFVACHLYNGVS
jgi:oligopeptide/dipeptide ABC transporter ATP-binding protein